MSSYELFKYLMYGNKDRLRAVDGSSSARSSLTATSQSWKTAKNE